MARFEREAQVLAALNHPNIRDRAGDAITGLKGSSGRKCTQEVKNQNDEKNGAQAYSGPSTISPTSIAIVSPASAKKQDQQNY